MTYPISSKKYPMFHFFKKNLPLFLICLMTIGAFFRFYALNWGAPYYFHPDERNIASSVTQLQFPQAMNPHFFAYGSLPIYSIYFSALPFVPKSFCQPEHFFCRVPFEYAIIVGRFYSAFFSLLLIPFLYILGKKIHSIEVGMLSATLATFSTGFLQFAHFATFELWTTFFTCLLFFSCLQLIHTHSIKNTFISGLLSGILVSIKVSNLIFLLIPLCAYAGYTYSKKDVGTKKILLSTLQFFFTYFTTLFLIFTITNPFTFLDFSAFKGSITYESQVALGTLPVFYTGEFFHTIPVIFQLQKIYPFLINPLLTLFLIPALVMVLILTWRKKSPSLGMLILLFSTTFFSQVFLFAKWTRYMVPTLPFIYLIIGVFITEISKTKKNNVFKISAIFLIILINAIFSVSYFISAFLHPDSRVYASKQAAKILPRTAPILSDVYDMGIVAFNEHFPSITLYNFYELDNNSQVITNSSLDQSINQYDYYILPSQRLFATRIINKQQFPNGYRFYKEVKNNTARFTKLYQSPCDVFCQITYLGDPVFRFEGTANSFDNPPIQIYEIRHEAH